MTIKESNVTINVKDLDRSVAFYESIGLTLKVRWGPYYAQMTAPGILIGLHPSAAQHLVNSSGNTSIGFTVDDFESSTAFLQQLAIPYTERKEEGGQFIHFNDPDGTALYIINPR